MALEIVQILAAGTFGHIAVVRDSANAMLYAAKVLRQEHLENAKLLHRMRDEAALLERIDHPHVVRALGIREIEGRPVILLEWVRGAPIDALLARMPAGLPPPEAVEIVRTCTAALAAAHQAVDPLSGRPMRVIHRDFKPSNVLLSIDGVIKVLDFGIAHGQFAGKQSETVTMVLGAHGYLAPERLDGAPDSPAGDVYALGCSLFELLCGRRMKLSLHRDSHDERLQRELMLLQPPDTNPRTMHEITELIRAMCAYDPGSRPDHTDVLGAATRVLLGAGWSPDLDRLARKHVVPLLEEQSFESPREHPAWPELSFLEAPSGETPSPPPPRQSDVALRGFLATDGWHHHREQLRRILASDPSWTAAPFVEVLDRIGGRKFLRGWRHDDDDRGQLVIALELLKARPGAEASARAKQLLRHPDPEVAELARQVVSGRTTQSRV